MKVVKKADDKETVREALFPKRNAPGESDVGQACANKKRKQRRYSGIRFIRRRKNAVPLRFIA
jgi:hypothetical protein